MIAFAEFLGRFKAHRFEIVPAGRILEHRYPVLVAQNDAGAVEDAPDSRIELPSDFGLGSPHGAQHRRDIHGGDLMDGAIEQGAGVSRAEMALPLISDFRIHRLPLRVLDDELGDLLERRNGLGGLLGGPGGLDGVDPAGDESPCLQGPVASVLEADCGIRAETLVLADPIDLVAQGPISCAQSHSRRGGGRRRHYAGPASWPSSPLVP